MSRRLYSQITNDASDTEENGRSAIPIAKKKAQLVNGIPLTGEDYLLTVRKQANACPQVVVASAPAVQKAVQLPARYQLAMAAFDMATSTLAPAEAWRTSFGKSFKTYREHKQKNKKKSGRSVMHGNDKKGWYQLCYGHSTEEPFDKSKLDIVADLPQRTILSLLNYHIQWVKEVTTTESLWLFALLLYLDPVLTYNDVSTLRDLARHLIALRQQKKEHDDAVARMNILITIIGQGFGQADLI